MKTAIIIFHRHPHYNNRLQMYDIRLGTSSTDEWTWNRGALRMFYDSNFAYGNGGANNNGNVYRMDHFVPTNESASEWSMSLDYYGYDELNRITGVWENKAAHNLGETSTGLTQQYLYDRFGNRTANNAVSNFPGVFNAAFNVDQSNNRLLAPNGTISYNAVGNQVNDGYSGAGARTYDANNKLVSATGSSGTVSYSYNANGSRVTKTVGSTTTWYIYGLGGELVAEYPANGAPSTPQIEYGYRGGELLIEGGCDAVRWRVTDHLGSTRMSVGTTGSLASVKRTDYLPFGEEIGAGVGPRTTTQGYSQTDCWRQKFTGYERDVETGLDYAMARMYAGAQGRFTSVDPSRVSVNVSNPQTWNRYVYSLNTPLTRIDKNGKWSTEIHNHIIDVAFSGFGNKNISLLKNASKEMDNLVTGHIKSNSHKHAMRGSETPKKAEEKFVEFVKGRARLAQAGLTSSTQASQLSETSVYSFGEGLHSLMDWVSPSHEGFQAWWLPNPTSARSSAQWTVMYMKHEEQEKAISIERMGIAVGIAHAYAAYTYGPVIAGQMAGHQLGGPDDLYIGELDNQRNKSQMAIEEEKYLYRLGITRGMSRFNRLFLTEEK